MLLLCCYTNHTFHTKPCQAFSLESSKPGGYRKPTEKQRDESQIGKEDFLQWFSQIWELPGVSTKNVHPAPFPLELATRLIKMFSFVDDVVLDPFSGTGTTMLVAINTGRNSICVEVEELYCHSSLHRLDSANSLFSVFKLSYIDPLHDMK